MRITLMLTLFACSLFLQAQDRIIKGRIANSDGQPHAGVMVQAYDTRTKVYTDENGDFSLPATKSTMYLTIENPFNKNEFVHHNITKIKNNFVTITINSYINGIVNGIKENIPLKNIIVEVVGQNKSTKTKKNGHFQFENLNNTKEIILRISDPQKLWKTKEVTLPVSRASNIRNNIILEQYISPLLATSSDNQGVVFLNENTPKLIDKSDILNLSDIGSIKSSKDGYKIKPLRKGETSKMQIEFSTVASLSKVDRLPKLQSTYAQGQNDNGEIVWQGADKNQKFSWGPEIASLEYNNGAYLYDKNGALVSKGLGNGIAAKSYNPSDFFRTGMAFNNSIILRKMLNAGNILSVSLGQDRINSPIPNSYQESYNGSASLDQIKSGLFESSFGVVANTSKNRLMNNGASHARIMQSILTTPPTFDNANGMSRKEALHNNASWQLANGSNRSYNPSEVSNPFGLIANLPDQDKSSNVLLYAKTKYKKNRFESNASLSFNRQWDKRTIGIVGTLPYESVIRKEDFSNVNFTTNATYQLSKYRNYDLKLNAAYAFNSEENDVTRNHTKMIDKNRLQHNVNYGASFDKKNLFLVVSNKHYFSNTATEYSNIFPSLGARYKVDNFFYDKLDWDFLQFARIFGSTARSLGEVPLVYRNLAALSTPLNSTEALSTYYEREDIVPLATKMKPEIYFNNEVGIELGMWGNKFNIEFIYFHNTTYGTVAPTLVNGSNFKLNNIGDHKNYGFLISANYYNQQGYGNNRVHTYIHANFSRTRNMATSVSDNKEFVQLAGFTNVGTFFKKNEPLGVIYGNTFQRDANRRIVIGADGFPLVDNSMTRIGDPTPDFIMNLTPNVSWKRFDLSFNLTYSKGGNVWNGTRAYLDYLGMSESSANDRNIKEYIFSGVTETGKLNNQIVNFYDPSLPLDQNKWVRYGAAGVAEDYIEDASFLRLSRVSLTYKVILQRNKHYFEDMTVGIHAHNLFQVTAYKGVDPSSNLFGYATGNGLDLFNMPSIRKYSLSINFKF